MREEGADRYHLDAASSIPQQYWSGGYWMRGEEEGRRRITFCHFPVDCYGLFPFGQLHSPLGLWLETQDKVNVHTCTTCAVHVLVLVKSHKSNLCWFFLPPPPRLARSWCRNLTCSRCPCPSPSAGTSTDSSTTWWSSFRWVACRTAIFF